MTETQIREWLKGYAWAEENDEDKDAVVACIMSQNEWQYLTAQADKFAGAQEEPGPEAFDEGMGFALSALYECHSGPHQDTCPSLRWLTQTDPNGSAAGPLS